jgi:hypothetical protein
MHTQDTVTDITTDVGTPRARQQQVIRTCQSHRAIVQVKAKEVGTHFLSTMDATVGPLLVAFTIPFEMDTGSPSSLYSGRAATSTSRCKITTKLSKSKSSK